MRRASAPVALSAALSLAALVDAHGHHQEGPADDSVPIDSILWLHILIQSLAWFILFPLTMVLGLTRHRLHVPLAVLALVLTTAGYFLGHGHGGRSFPHTAHGTVANLLIPLLMAQGALGVYLKLHLKWKAEGFVRPIVIFAHGLIGKLFSILGWLQMLLGIITLRSWCMGGRTGQCLAHHIMGSAFIGYGTVLLIMLKAGVSWLSRRKTLTSQEFLDSTVIFAWGCVNALTEHHGGPWTHKDLQHTLLGVVWVAGGAAGMWLSKGGRRSVVPAVVIIITGWAMSGHAQALMISTMIHALFGYCLMAAGAARIIEVCFVLGDGPTGEQPDSERPSEEDERQRMDTEKQWFPIRAFQYLPPWLLFASGVLFMSATDEELRWADSYGVDHITWGLIDFSISFFLFLWANVLIDLYTSQGGRYGSARKAAASATAGRSGRAGLAESGGLRSLYSRVSMGESAPLRVDEDSEEGVVSGSSGSLEMNRLEGKRAKNDRSDAQMNGNVTGNGGQGHHVLFDDDEDEEDDDPFDDERRR
ncbi:hypothetical protein FA10DRAFT_266720 [Acaromyces ingoldii]|uniref:YTP1 n=1 Tax=Acaromyces ingoldii TaxID=215250 RepID=A0A316YM04_9BASI|nr:hypothetical protein FA10DRAFT_266720 [Acaromyces ingoldii]PWN90231.1 hypothetical protein FA10DRAFT_266720 [Acaromyces ingoldii]